MALTEANAHALPTPSLYLPSPQGISRWGQRQDSERLGYFPRAT